MRYLITCLAILAGASGVSAQVLDGKSLGKSGAGDTEVAQKSAQALSCVDGLAGQFDCLNVDLLGHLSLAQVGAVAGVRLNDVWGWEDQGSGRRFVLLGREDGTSFVEVTDPGSPVFVANLPRTRIARNSGWRDIKVVGNHAFIVSDGAGQHGMQVVDLTHLLSPPAPVPFLMPELAHYEGFGSSHNIVANEEAGFVFAVGSSSGVCDLGLHMIDVSDPARPQFAGCFQDARTRRGYSHDAQCVIYQGPDTRHRGREICIGSNEDSISIADVTDKGAPVPLGVGTYPAAAYVHQGWLTDDHRYFYQDDELDERADGTPTRTMIWDLEDLDDPVLAAVYEADTPAIDHNLYVKGDLLFQANYTSGLRVLDISNRTNPFTVGYFDTTPGDEGTTFGGTWSVYPYFTDGTLALSSRGEGLFLLKLIDTIVTQVGEFDVQSLRSGDVRFVWTMDSQRNVEALELERLMLSGDYEVLARVTGAGTTAAPSEFDVSTNQLPEGKSVVRLVAVSPSGGREVLLEEDVFVVPGTHVIKEAFPNPAATSARVSVVVAEPQRVAVRVFDSAGRLVARVHDAWVSPEEEVLISLDVTSWPAGTYWVQYEGTRFKDTRTLVVAH